MIVKQRNPIAKVVKALKPSIVVARKGKGSYNRKKLKGVRYAN